MVTQPAGSLADTGTRGAPKFSKFWLGIAYSLYDAGHIRWFLYLSNPYLDGTRVIAHSCTTFPGTHIKTCDQKILIKTEKRLKELKCIYLIKAVSYTHLRAHETDSYLVCRLLLEK